jgi:hypothetical protein
MKTEAACLSEISTCVYQTAWRLIRRDSCIHSHCCEGLIYHGLVRGISVLLVPINLLFQFQSYSSCHVVHNHELFLIVRSWMLRVSHIAHQSLDHSIVLKLKGSTHKGVRRPHPRIFVFCRRSEESSVRSDTAVKVERFVRTHGL